jgi:MFS family permease
VVPRLDSPKAFAAVLQLFLFNGLVVGVYAGSLPTLKVRHGMLDWQLSVLFIVVGVGSITAMQTCGRLSDRVGVRPVALAAMVPQVLAPVALALSPNYGALLASGFVLGLGNGGLDVTMNALAVHVEKARPKPVMSFFHGMWSVGNLGGAGLIVAVAWLSGWAATRTMVFSMAAIAVVGAAVAVSAWRITPQTAPVEHVAADGTKAPIPRAAYLLGLMAIAFGVGEGTGSDWSGVHVKEVAGVGPDVAALGVVAMAACMVLIRVCGDLLVTRFGRRAVVRFGGVCAVTGYLVVSLVSPLPLLLVGWALVGLGMGVVAPQVYGVAGHMAGGRGLAVVVTFGYATFLASPAVIGALVTAIGVQRTMLVPGALMLGLVALAGVLPKPEDDPALHHGS